MIDKALGSAVVLVSAGTIFEAGMVAISRMGSSGFQEVLKVIQELDAEVRPLDLDLAIVCVEAFDKFGKGRHPASLNFGDCMVYALAKSEKMPVLCTGDDFSKTDIVVA